MSTLAFTTHGFAGALAASDRRFQMSQLRIQRENQQRQIDQINQVVNRELEEQRKMVELQNTVIESLDEATRLQTEAMDAIEAAQNTDRDETKKLLEDIRSRLDEIANRVEVGFKELETWRASILTAHGNIQVHDFLQGFIAPSENGRFWQIRVDDSGVVYTTNLDPENV